MNITIVAFRPEYDVRVGCRGDYWTERIQSECIILFPPTLEEAANLIADLETDSSNCEWEVTILFDGLEADSVLIRTELEIRDRAASLRTEALDREEQNKKASLEREENEKKRTRKISSKNSRGGEGGRGAS